MTTEIAEGGQAALDAFANSLISHCRSKTDMTPHEPRSSVSPFLSLWTLFGTFGKILDLPGKRCQVGPGVVSLEFHDSLAEHEEALVQCFDRNSETVNLLEGAFHDLTRRIGFTCCESGGDSCLRRVNPRGEP
jgi:hypothetical protein